MFKRISFLVLTLLLLLAASVAAAPADGIASIGICSILSPNILGDRDNEAPNMIYDAAKNKFPSPRYSITPSASATDFKNFLGKKDILISDVTKMIPEIKLPIFVSYGQEKNLDYVVVIFVDAVTNKFEKKQATGWLGAWSGGYSSSNQMLVKNAQLTARVVVDVKKQEYIYNVLLNKNVDDHYGYATDVRAIRAVVKEFVKDFEQQITL